jgi:type III secretory pathway component EscU
MKTTTITLAIATLVIAVALIVRKRLKNKKQPKTQENEVAQAIKDPNGTPKGRPQ